MVDEVVAGDSQTENEREKRQRGGFIRGKSRQRSAPVAAKPPHQFFFPRIKKELPSGMGTIFSLGPEKSGLSGATPAKRCTCAETGGLNDRSPWSCDLPALRLTLQPLDGPQLLVFLPVVVLVLHEKETVQSSPPGTIIFQPQWAPREAFGFPTAASSSSFSSSSSHSSSSSFFSLNKRRGKGERRVCFPARMAARIPALSASLTPLCSSRRLRPGCPRR